MPRSKAESLLITLIICLSLLSRECCRVRSFVLLPLNLPAKHALKEYNPKAKAFKLKLNSGDVEGDALGESKREALRLKKLADDIRASIPEEKTNEKYKGDSTVSLVSNTTNDSAFVSTDEIDQGAIGYRLYIDVGREPGTWMEPRWGASGKRIEFTLDVHFLLDSLAVDADVLKCMNAAKGDSIMTRVLGKGRTASDIYILKSSDSARLRSGFDKMKCRGGAYFIEKGSGSKSRFAPSTVRFFIDVDGTPQIESTYGDIYVPKGSLYFSIPCFGSLAQLSSKEGIVTIRKVGWNTGLRREESRILGTFRAVPIEEARSRDKY